MKAEISHHGFISDSRVSGVYLQQGRMLTDRDWNALCDRLRALLEKTAAPLAGDGAPRHGGLIIDFAEADPTTRVWSARFADAGGLVVAEGAVGALAPADTDAPFAYDNQRDLPEPPMLDGGTALFVDVWDKTQTVFDDADLADPGLYGADTCFVTHRVAQVKQCPAGALVETACGLELSGEGAPRIGDARFEITPRGSTSGADPCDPCAEIVDLEQAVTNHLFRLEVHDVGYSTAGDAETLVLKWSRHNGAIQYDRPREADEAFDHARLDPDYAYEFFTDAMELQAGLPPGGYGDRFARGVLAHENLSTVDERLDRIRQWDGYCEIDLAGSSLVRGWDRTETLSTGVAGGAHGALRLTATELRLDLETVTVVLGIASDAGRARFLVGDHWLALSRARVEGTDRIRALQPTPIGIRHRYCVLGEALADGRTFGSLDARDRRRLDFPALSCLAADDVGYDPANCAYAGSRNVTNVRETLDAFCERLQPPYHVLRMNQGTGQEGAPATLLPCPVVVLVEDQDGLPVEGASVVFAAEADDQVFGNPAEADPSAGQREVTVVTDSTGHAEAWWWVDAPEGCHRLRARLPDAPQAEAGEIWFAATVRRRPGEPSDLLVLTNVSWQNDRALKLDEFLGGLEITFSGEVELEPVTPDVFIVTLEVPEAPFAPDRGDSPRLGFRTLVVAGEVDSRGRASCRFVPRWDESEELENWIRDRVREASDLEHPNLPGLRCRVRLLGRMIGAADGNGRLDAFVPGARREGDATIRLDFEGAGVGHPSDFESWFYLTLGDGSRGPIIDVNRAGLEELTTLPFVSREIARAIIERRPYGDIDELTRVPGIGPTRLDTLRPLVRV